MIRDHEAIQRYLDEVCSHVRSSAAHKDIRHELETHLEELVLDREEDGNGREEAVLWAINQMGSPTEVGSGLHSVHRPKMHWGLLIGIMAFVILGIFAMVAVEASMTTGFNGSLIKSKLLAVSIGVIVMIMCYLFDYRKIKTYSYGLYAVIIFGMVLTWISGSQVNGSSYLNISFISIDWFGISPYLLMIAAPGMIMSWKKHKGFWLFTTTTLLLVPTILMLSFSTMSHLMLYLAGYLFLLLFITRNWWAIGIHTIGMGLFMFLAIMQKQYQYPMTMITALLNPGRDPQGAGYVYQVVKESIRSAGWWGHGIKGEMTQVVPNIPTDNILVFLIYSFGWTLGIVISLSLVYFIGRLLQANRAVREPYGQALAAGVAGMLSFQMVYGLLMSLGLVPLVGIPFPFLSLGGSHLMIEMAVMGLVLGIYRRKDLVGSHGDWNARIETKRSWF